MGICSQSTAGGRPGIRAIFERPNPRRPHEMVSHGAAWQKRPPRSTTVCPSRERRDRRVSFPPLVTGGLGGVVLAQSIAGTSKGLLSRLAWWRRFEVRENPFALSEALRPTPLAPATGGEGKRCRVTVLLSSATKLTVPARPPEASQRQPFTGSACASVPIAKSNRRSVRLHPCGLRDDGARKPSSSVSNASMSVNGRFPT